MTTRLNITIHPINNTIAPFHARQMPEEEQAGAHFLVDLTQESLDIHACKDNHPLIQTWPPTAGKLKFKLNTKVLYTSLQELTFDNLFINLLKSLQKEYSNHPQQFDANQQLDAFYIQHYLDNLPCAVIKATGEWLSRQISLRDFIAAGDVMTYAFQFHESEGQDTLLTGELVASMRESLQALMRKEQQYLGELPCLLDEVERLLHQASREQGQNL